MATLNIRRRGQSTLRMPNVRQVDYSAIGNNAYTRLQASGQSFAPAIEQLAHAGTKWLETLNATDEKEASKLAQKVALAQDEAKEQILQDMQLNPSNASTWEEQWSKAVEGINKQFGVDALDKNSYRYRQYEEKMAVPTHNARMSMMKAYNNIQIKDIKETAQSDLEFSAKNAIDSDAMVTVTNPETGEVFHEIANQEAVNEAYASLEKMGRLNNWSEGTMALKRAELDETLALGVANRMVAKASTIQALDVVDKVIKGVGSEDLTQADKNAIAGAFGAIDPKKLTPERRVALQDAIRKKRSALERQELEVANEEVVGVVDAYRGGKLSWEAALQKIDEADKRYSATTASKMKGAFAEEVLEDVLYAADSDTSGKGAKAAHEQLKALKDAGLSYSQFESARAKIETIHNAHAVEFFQDNWETYKQEFLRTRPNASATDLVEGFEAFVPVEYRGTSGYQKLKTLAAQGLVEAEIARQDVIYDDLVFEIVNNTTEYLSEEEAIARFQEVVDAYPQKFKGSAGETEKNRILKKIKIERQANVEGFKGMLAQRYNDANFLSNLARNSKYRNKDIRHPKSPFEIQFTETGDVNVAATLQGLAPEQKEYRALVTRQLNLISQTYEMVLDVAAKNPSYTAKQLYELFDAAFHEGNDVLIATGSASILTRIYQDGFGARRYNAARLGTQFNIAEFESVMGVGQDVPFDAMKAQMEAFSAAASKRGKEDARPDLVTQDEVQDVKNRAVKKKGEGFNPSDRARGAKAE